MRIQHKNALKGAIIFGLCYGALTIAFKAAAQAAPPAGVPAGVTWTQGRAGGGPVTTGPTFPQYSYPTMSQLPFKANTGTLLQFGGIAVGAGGAAIGQPAPAALIGSSMAAIGGQMAKDDRAKELNTPSISERNTATLAPVGRAVGSAPPVSVGFGGGAIMPASGCHPFCNKPK